MTEQEKSPQRLEELDDEVVNQDENHQNQMIGAAISGDEPLTAPTPALLKPEPPLTDIQIDDIPIKPSDSAKVTSTKPAPPSTSPSMSPPSSSKATIARQKNKQVLLAYQNRPRCCQQLWDQVGAHMKQLYRHACAVIAVMIIVPIVCIGQLYYIRSVTTDKTYPDHSLEKLKHPVYSTAYYQPEFDEFGSSYTTALDQQLEFESFMQFNNYTNADRKTDEVVLGPEGEEIPVKVRSYVPVMDQMSPYNWVPSQCSSGVDYKYPSSVIGYIKHGNKLEEDLLSQIQGLHRDQTQISAFAEELEIFFSKISLGPSPPEDVIPEPSDGGVSQNLDSETVEEEELAEPDPLVWVIDPTLIDEAGGGPEVFSVIDVDVLGEFDYVEFDSQEDLFSYVQQPGYGWDEDKPAVCFAFEVHENEAQNKYEVEFYFRDQWPYHSQTGLRHDTDPTEIESDYDIMSYTYIAYNGINMMQVFAANSIMQRKLTPEAEIILMTHPYKMKLYSSSAFDLGVQSLLPLFFILILMPIAFHYAYAMGRERETRQRQTLIANGLGLFTHFSSWLLHYTVVNFFISLIFVMGTMPLVFTDDDTTLIFAISFLSIESVFGMLWCLQPFFRSGRIAVFITAFFFFLSYYGGFLIDQKFPLVDTDAQKQICLAPIAAIKRTFDTYANWHLLKFPSTWDNYDREKRGFSLAIGLQMYLIDLVLWSFVGFLIEILMNIGMYFKSCFNMNIRFQNTSEGVVEISKLRARTKNAPIYEFKLQKSTITCLVGNDSSQQTHLMEMLAGQRACKGSGTMTVKDSDFFARGNNPKLTEFVTFRSSEVVLDDELTAVDHLNMYAHLRGSQKCKNTRILCEKLMPTNKQVKYFSESQRQCLQTLLALASENSRIILLDEPTRGLGPILRSEIIKALWKFKRDRYVLIASSDTEMINVLADSVAKILPTGIQMVNAKPSLANNVNNIKVGSFKLIVEVEGGKPSDGLVRYLSKDVPELTLEYHTDLLTYYVLSNISYALLYKKTKFLEKNRKMLGLIEFEAVSLTNYEIEARSIPRDKLDERLLGSFDESIDEQEYAQVQHNQPNSNSRTILSPSDLLKSDKSDVAVVELGPESQRPMTELTDKRRDHSEAHDKDQSDLTDPSGITPEVEFDEEMRAFNMLMDEPLRRPAYKRELQYDFRRYKPKRSFCCTQCCCICVRHTRDHCRNKSRFLALILMPSIFVFLAWHCTRYLKQGYSQSRLTSPDMMDLKQPILINSKTQVGGHDTQKWVQKMPMYEEAFEPTFIDTQSDEQFYGFRDACYDFSVNTVLEEPYNIGAYQFYEMDEERHKYKINSFLNTTNPYATQLFPQFIIEGVLKEALGDDEFEFKFRTTPLPVPFENTQKGDFVTSEDLYWNEVIITMSQAAGITMSFYSQAIGAVSLGWLILNMITVTQLIRERTSQRKHFQEQHGQSKLAYWIARFCHDILFYLPISMMAAEMIERFDPQMEQAPQSLLLQPFAMLPFLYCWSHFFSTEISGMLATGLYQVGLQWLGPQTIFLMRLNYTTEPMGDGLMSLFKMIPLTGAPMTMMFNSKALYVLNRYRDGNSQGEGEPIETDEANEINAPADRFWIFVHIIVFWAILLFFIEWKVHRYICFCCTSRMREVRLEDNANFFGKLETSGEMSNNEYDGESSEVAQIIGDGEQLELRFNRKQTPKRQLAYTIENLSLVRRGRCCRKKEYLISDLSAQVQAGSKFAIVSEGSQGATSILNTISNRKSAFNVAGIIRKQVGRGIPVYTTQSNDVLFADLSLSTNLNYYVNLGSIHARFVKQMLVAFGLYSRKSTQVKNLTATERHIAQLIIALAGAHQTVILDEPFTGLTQEQSVKLVKILRQKDDCTIIITAKSKAQIELLQPQSVLTIRTKQEPYKTPTSEGYVLAFRLKPFDNEMEPIAGERMPAKDMLSVNQSMASFAGISNVDLGTFLQRNFRIFEKLRGKKRSLVVSAITKIMRKAKLTPEISEEIAEMVHEDMELQMTNEELALKCQLVRSLFALVEALCKRFGEVHLEQRQDDYAVLRVVFNETCRLKGLDDSFSDQNPVFSSVVEFVDSNDVVESCSLSCQFLGNGRTLQSGSRRGGGRPVVKTFRYSEEKQRMERTNPFHSTASQASLPSLI